MKKVSIIVSFVLVLVAAAMREGYHHPPLFKK
jgi:hypothetical protein